VYVRTVGNETLEFRHRGWLVDESFIFYDRTYDSLWVQATGTCIKGKFRGQQLATVPVTHTTWGEWKALYPGTNVLAKPIHLRTRYARDGYEHYYAERGTRFGLAVFAGGEQKLYPLDVLAETPVVHDEIGGQAVLVVYHAPSQTAVALEPVSNGTPLKLELAEVTEHDVRLREAESGDSWSGMTGQQSSDPTRRLPQLHTTQFVVSNWPRHFPQSPVYAPR
jgi:hypothetical protein